ncbi:MAG TPA: hypothetical protein DC015_00560 [Aequorivita sp.]|nr:hypothetical protein [Aequorivita sp.]
MKKITFIILFTIAAIHTSTAQEQSDEEHTSGKGLRIAGVIGHTYINSDGTDGNLYIPSWGLDIDYWFNHKWGIGLHNDLEIENFVVVRNDTEENERANPLVFTLDALYEIGNGFVLSIGPGVELEKNESFFLARVGLEYEYDINKNFYIMPTLFHDQRFDGFSTTTVGLGLGHRF